MLRELRIKNFAIIDEVVLQLGHGLNIITGETGAGKSIILNALGLISGERGSSEIIRHKEEEATVEALFETVPPSLSADLSEAGFEVGGELIIKRILNRSGKNRIYLNGSLCPLGLLSQVGASLVHIYGQHEHPGVAGGFENGGESGQRSGVGYGVGDQPGVGDGIVGLRTSGDDQIVDPEAAEQGGLMSDKGLTVDRDKGFVATHARGAVGPRGPGAPDLVARARGAPRDRRD